MAIRGGRKVMVCWLCQVPCNWCALVIEFASFDGQLHTHSYTTLASPNPNYTHIHYTSLTKDVEKRPHYSELLTHPLILEYETKSVDIGRWYQEVCKIHGPPWHPLPHHTHTHPPTPPPFLIVSALRVNLPQLHQSCIVSLYTNF